MKNITITLDDKLASTARVEAAKQGKSLSRFVSELVEDRVSPKAGGQLEALEIFLSGPLWNLTDENGKAPTREEIYDDALLHRHERADLHSGGEEPIQAGARKALASGNRKS